MSSRLLVQTARLIPRNTRSLQTMSFASPESDFSAFSHGPSWFKAVDPAKKRAAVHISFSSPESDFACGAAAPPTSSVTLEQLQVQNDIKTRYSFTSPESDFLSTNVSSSHSAVDDFNLGFASPESDFSGSVARGITALEIEPRILTYSEAIMPSPQPRVITEAYVPFKVVHANEAWVQMKGNKELETVVAKAALKALGRKHAVAPLNQFSQINVVPIESSKYLLHQVETINTPSQAQR